MFNELAFISITITGKGETSALTQIGLSCYDLSTQKVSRVWHRYIYEGEFTFNQGGSRVEVAKDLAEAKLATQHGVPLEAAIKEMESVLAYEPHSVIGSNDKEDRVMICGFNSPIVYQNLFARCSKAMEAFHCNVLDLHSICYMLHLTGVLPKIDTISSLMKEFDLRDHINPGAPMAVNYSVIMAYAFKKITKLFPEQKLDISDGPGLRLIRGGKHVTTTENKETEVEAINPFSPENSPPEGPERA